MLGLVYGVGVFRLRLFDLVPVARDAVLEGLPDVVIVLDSEDRVVDVNRAGGEPAREAGGATSSGAGRIGRSRRGPPWARSSREGTDKPRTVEWTGPPPGWLEVSVSPLHDRLGRRAGRVVVARDVTARHRADEQVRLLSAAIGSAATAVAISDPSGVCLWVNPAFTRTTGYSPRRSWASLSPG